MTNDYVDGKYCERILDVMGIYATPHYQTGFDIIDCLRYVDLSERPRVMAKYATKTTFQELQVHFCEKLRQILMIKDERTQPIKI